MTAAQTARPPRRRGRRAASLAALIAALLSGVYYQYFGNTAAEAPARAQGFDFYLLALTLEPAFCEDGDRQSRQCRQLDAAAFARTPLVLHGLWPENRAVNAYPQNCPGPRLALSANTRARLPRWMPGAGEGLDVHEWRKHGTCSGLDAETYYQAALDATERANRMLAGAIRQHTGRSVDAATLRAAADAVEPGFGRSLVFMCKNLRSPDPQIRSRPYLYEVRVCVDNDGASGSPGTLLQCATVGRRDQGCGAQFWIDDV